MEAVPSTTRSAVVAPLSLHSGDGGPTASLHKTFYPFISRVRGAVRVPFVFAIALMLLAVLAHAQTSQSGTATARLNKDLLVPNANETAQIRDAVSITYSMTPTSTGAQLTVMCQYNGSGESETSGRSYTLTGSDQQSATFPSSTPSTVVLHSLATVTQTGLQLSVVVRVDYLVTLTEDGDLIISVTGLEVAE